MIELKNVSFRYKDSEQDNSLTIVNLSIHDGEAVLICGGSGCGKTTLLSLLGGLDVPTKGEVVCNGENINNWD